MKDPLEQQIGTFLLDVFAMVGRHSVLFLFFRRQFHWSHAGTYIYTLSVHVYKEDVLDSNNQITPTT